MITIGSHVLDELVPLRIKYFKKILDVVLIRVFLRGVVDVHLLLVRCTICLDVLLEIRIEHIRGFCTTTSSVEEAMLCNVTNPPGACR